MPYFYIAIVFSMVKSLEGYKSNLLIETQELSKYALEYYKEN